MLTENTIEQSLIEQLIAQGYTYHYGPDIAPFGDNPQRENFASVLLENHFKDSLERLNPNIPASARAEAYQKVINLGTEDIMENNERFHSYLTNGVTVEFNKEGRTVGVNARLMELKSQITTLFGLSISWWLKKTIVKNDLMSFCLSMVYH